MKDQIKKILSDGDTENKLNKAVALSDLLMAASTTDNLPDGFSIFYAATELYTTAKDLQNVYENMLAVIREHGTV